MFSFKINDTRHIHFQNIIILSKEKMLEIFLCWDSLHFVELIATKSRNNSYFLEKSRKDNEPNSKYSKDIKDSHLSLKKENGGVININI